MSDPGASQKIDLTSYEAMKKQMAASPVEQAAPTPVSAASMPVPTDTAPQGTIPAAPQDEAGLAKDIAAGGTGAPSKPGILAKAGAAIGDALAGFGIGAVRSVPKAVGGAVDTGQDLLHEAGKGRSQLPLAQTLALPEIFPGQHAIAALMLGAGAIDRKGSMADTLSAKEYLGKIGNNAVNEGTANIGSLILGTAAFGEGKLFSYLPKVIDGGLKFGAAAGLIGDPNAERFSSALNNLGVHSEFTDWLGAPADQAGAFENRFKNAIEGTVSGIALDGVFQGAKYMRSVLKGVPDAAAKDASEAAFKEIVPEAAHPAANEVSAVRGAGHMEVRVDGEPVAQIPSDTFNGLVDDAASQFKTNPATIAMEHQAEVSALEAEGTAKAATPKAAKPGEPFTTDLSTGTPEAIQRGKPPFQDLSQGAPESITKAKTGFLPGLDNEAVAPLLRSMSIKLHDTPHVVITDAERNAAAMAAAREVGVDPTDMLAYAAHVAGNVVDSHIGVTTTQILWRNMASTVDGMSLKGITESASEAEIQAHKAAINNVVAFTRSFQDIRAGLGRGLRSTAMLRKAADYVGEKIGVDDAGSKLFKEGGNPMPPQPNTIQDINDFYSVWNDLKGDPAARMNMLRGNQTLPSQLLYLRTSFANLFTANALAGLPSVAMNVIGPSIIGVLHTLEKTTGGFIGALNPLLSQSERAGMLATASNASRAYVQTVGDVPDAFRFALQAVKENKSILGGGWTVDVGRMGPVTNQMLRAAKMQDGVTVGYQLGNLINWWPRAFQRINSGLDEFAKRLSYMGEIRLNAMVEHDTSPALQAQMPKEAYVKSAMENSIDAVGEATNETALRTAERTTLTGELSGNDYHPLVGKASQFVQAMRSQFPETRYILPVFNVPANSLGENIRRIPGLNLFLGETRAELSGDLGAVRQADAYGRTMLGAAFMLWAYHMSRTGQMTGAGPQDPGNRKAWSDQGYMPYSIRIGDKWVDYSRYDLPGAMLAIPSNVYDSTVYHRSDDPGMEARMVGSFGALAQYFKDKAALQGASNLMNFGASPGADESFFHRTMNSVVSRMAVPNFVTQLGRNTTDDLKRNAVSPSEALMNALPMASKELDPMRNVLGEPLHIPRDSLVENMLPVTIAPATTFKSDPVMTELDRLRQATGVAPGVTHPSAFDNNFYDSTQVKLEDGRSLYDHLVAARMTTVDPNNGRNLRAALTDLFQRPEYKAAKDADASNLVDSNGNVSRGAVISKVFDVYNKASIQAVAQESPIAKHMLAITAAKKIDDDRLRPYSAPDLATNPKLLQSLGIDISKYEQKVSGK